MVINGMETYGEKQQCKQEGGWNDRMVINGMETDSIGSVDWIWYLVGMTGWL